MWTVIINVLNDCKPSTLNYSFTYSNRVITVKKIFINEFNDFFVNVDKTLAAQIPEVGP